MEADSLRIVEQLGQLVPWLNADVKGYLAHVLLGIPIVVAILGLEFTSSLISRLSPAIAAVTARVGAWSFILNPLIAALLGYLLGNSTLGLVAGGVWSSGNAAVKRFTGKSVQTVLDELQVRGAAAILLCCLGLLMASPSGAAVSPPSVAYAAVQQGGQSYASQLLSPKNFSLAVGGLYCWEQEKVCIAVQPGWRLPLRRLTLRARLAWRYDDWSRPTQREVGAWLTF